MEAVKILEMQPRRTPRRKGLGTYRMVATGTGEALPGPVTCGCVLLERACPITGNPGSGWRAGWGSEAAVVCAGRRRELAGESPVGPAPSGVRSRRRG